MTDIFQLASSSSSSINCSSPKNNDVLYRRNSTNCNNNNNITSSRRQIQGSVEAEEEEEGVSVLAVFVTVLKKYSLAGCNSKSSESSGVKKQLMEIGLPTDVRHVAHVTFDRFKGFLGLPVEFEPDVPRRPPSASTRVFGVSTESMQLSFDSRGNCVPTILLMMQIRLYEHGGLRSEGIFRINPGNGQEEHVREQLNNGVIPDNIDVHCLAGLIKAWFRELPNGILDSLPPEEVMGARSEDGCARLVKLLPPTEGALLDWAINLMADVAKFEHFNKMSARNIAMVFAPNMTRMSDPLTALMFVVQVMNFLKTLIEKVLKEREDFLVEAGPMLPLDDPSDQDGHHSKSITVKGGNEISTSSSYDDQTESRRDDNHQQTPCFVSSIENTNAGNTPADDDPNNSVGIGKIKPARRRRAKNGQSSNSRNDAKRKGSREHSTTPRLAVGANAAETKKMESNIVRHGVNSHAEWVETWR